MAAPKLTDAEREEITRRLARNESKTAIARAMGCSLDTVKYYAGKRTPLIEQIKEKFAPQLAAERAERDAEAAARIEAPILAGLREEDGRTDALVWLASELHHILSTDGFYGTDVKMSGSGKTVEVPAFRNAEVSQFRAALDDVAKERNQRKSNVRVTGKDDGPIEFATARERLTSRITLLAARVGAGSGSGESDGSRSEGA